MIPIVLIIIFFLYFIPLVINIYAYRNYHYIFYYEVDNSLERVIFTFCPLLNSLVFVLASSELYREIKRTRNEKIKNSRKYKIKNGIIKISLIDPYGEENWDTN